MAGEDDAVEPDILAEAREALKRAAEARGADPDEALQAPPPRPDPGDPFASAREALEKAARVRSELGESPRQREGRLRALEQLELLKAARDGGARPLHPSDAGPSDPSDPGASDPSDAGPTARTRRL